MEIQVKERIVGAVVLVGLGVWLIPWVLDGTNESSTTAEPEPALTLPAPDERVAPVRTETVEIEPSPRTPVEPGRRDAGTNQSAGSAPGSSVADTANGSDAAPEMLADTDTDTNARAAGATETNPPSGDVPVAAAEALAGNAAEDAPPPAPAAAEPAADAWFVQLGAFGERANADQLAARVSGYGYSGSVSEIRSNGQLLYRVRVGGFDGENEAEAAASSLSAHGFPSRVIPPE